MTLVAAVYVPSGIVMAADSRLTATRRSTPTQGDGASSVLDRIIVSDQVNKLVPLQTVPYCVGVYDSSLVDNQPVDSVVTRFDQEQLAEGDSVGKVAEKLTACFREGLAEAAVGFVVAGYQAQGKRAIPYVYSSHTRQRPEPLRVNVDARGVPNFNVHLAGDVSVAQRLFAKGNTTQYMAFTLQDAVDYVVYLIRTTAETQRFEHQFQTVGGPVDIFVLTPEKRWFVQRKELHGERSF